MEGYPAWHKYQTEAAIHLLRWGSEFTEAVWIALSTHLQPYRQGHDGQPHDFISAAIVLHRQNATALADLAQLFNITEQQLWALLIVQSQPDTTSLDLLSDARDQIHRITAQINFAQQRRLLTNFNYGSAERQRQSDRARNPRNKIGDSEYETTMAALISDLANDREYTGLSAKQLWPVFISALDAHHLDPVEDDSKSGKPRCTYDCRGKRKSITLGHFSNVVATSRKKSD